MTDCINSLVEEWVNSGKLEKYLKERYETWVISYNGSWVEVFIGDDEIDDLDDDSKGFEDTYYMVEQFMTDNNIKSNNENDETFETFYTVLDGGVLNVCALSEMVDYKELDLETDENGKILYLNADDETIKNIYQSLQVK